MKCALFVMGLLTINMATVADAQHLPTVKQLYDQCASTDSAEQDRCSYFIAGAMEVMTVNGRMHGDRYGICFEDDNTEISVSAAVRAFTDWVEKTPASLAKNSIVGVMVALALRWPCDLRKR